MDNIAGGATTEQETDANTAQGYVARAYAARNATSGLGRATIQRRQPGQQDVQIDILFCGVCHSDLHQVRNEWSEAGNPTIYPCVPGHEIVGRVSGIGSSVSKFKVGDLAAVGCIVDSDRVCPECQAGLEQYCPNMVGTYNSPDQHLSGVTYGGYSDSIVVDERYVLRAPAQDRKSTRLNSSHMSISYAVFCLKKKKIKVYREYQHQHRTHTLRQQQNII